MAEIVILDKTTAGELAADVILALVARKPDAVLGLATGSTPLAVYQALAARGADLTDVRGFALDEYVGLPPGHPESYRAVITREVVEPLGLDPSLVRVPGDRGPIETAGEDYERSIVEAGGVDLDPGDRHRWSYRIQRARFVVRIPHAREDAHPTDPRGQRAFLRLGR